ncbi:hypothetical protein ACIQWN_28845 [Streptomyces vinaceus]|uniref:hypothetical protein n=1 Tax=Streptomyces vinaceus TaxID=1960 RepID=UPI00382A3D05
MNRTTHLALAASTALLLAGCTSPQAADSKAQPAAPAAASSAAPKPASDASSTYKAIAAAVPSATGNTPVTADNDPNHLLGRPGQYTSKITFKDSRIKTADTEGLQPGDVSLGGAIEAFTAPAEAEARANYIRTVTQGMPMLTEYDYVHGTNLIRVSRLLTPEQAGDYEKAAAKLP